MIEINYFFLQYFPELKNTSILRFENITKAAFNKFYSKLVTIIRLSDTGENDY